MRLSEAAKLLGVTPATVRRYITVGLQPKTEKECHRMLGNLQLAAVHKPRGVARWEWSVSVGAVRRFESTRKRLGLICGGDCRAHPDKPHTCPYRVEIDDDDSRCECCPNCRSECADRI